MVLSDRMAYRQIIGSLMYNPLLFLEYTDILPTDFDNKVARVCFIAIHNLYEEGATKLTVIEVEEEVLKNNGASAAIYKNDGGLEFLKIAYEFAEPSNFELYYNRLKKYSLLRRLKKEHYDISDYYKEDKDIIEPIEEVYLQERFDNATLEDILNNVEGKYNLIRNDFLNGGKKKGDPAEGIFELIEEFQKKPNIGPSLEGKYFSSACRGARAGCFYLKSSSSGTGKALPNSTIIPTPVGFKRVDEIEVGDYLFDAFGKPTKVLGVYPQGEKEVWRVTFKDGRTAHCCEDHLWSYCSSSQSATGKEKRLFKIKTLKEINKQSLYDERGYSIQVPMTYAVEYPSKQYKIDPYVFGLFLGDGSFRQCDDRHKSIMYSGTEEFLPQKIAEIMNWEIKPYSSAAHRHWYFGYKDTTIKHNVWVTDFLEECPELFQATSLNKFIPKNYLLGSIEQRYALLNGLLDTDGTFLPHGEIIYYTISSSLKDDVVELCQSLGLKATVCFAKKEHNDCYNITITGRPEDKKKLFVLPRKHQQIENWYHNKKRKEKNEFNPIVKIESTGYSEKMTCFMVDNIEHLFLTENYIVTHNTRTSIFDACKLTFPRRWSFEKNTFIQDVDLNGKPVCPRKVLFIVTEMDIQELQTIILAYLSGVNETHILTGKYEIGELQRVKFAAKIMQDYSGYLLIEEISDPNLVNIESTIKKYATIDNIKYCFFDYIHTTASMLSQFQKNNLNEATILMMMANQLKQLAKDYGIFIFSATQVNMSAMDDDGSFKNEMSIRGSKAVADKADFAYVMSKIGAKTWNSIVGTLKQGAREGLIKPEYLDEENKPTHIIDIYKNRRGRYKNVRIWTKIDLGSGYRKDLFITTADNQPLSEPIDLFNSAREEVINYRDYMKEG